jgi:hypothetical protein
MSTDEVSAYATVTPTSVKFKGVLNKLSKIDLNYNSSSGNMKQQDLLDDNKVYKKNNNVSKSIKKFLGFGKKDDFYASTSPSTLEISGPIPNQMPISLTSTLTSSSEEESSSSSFNSNLIISDEPNSNNNAGNEAYKNKPSIMPKPPPPPPRLQSLAMLQQQVGVVVVNQKGTVRPPRPPPPVRPNQVAPSFTAVFDNPPSSSVLMDTNNGTPTSTQLDDFIPPCKPRRKNSVLHAGSSGRELEATVTVT